MHLAPPKARRIKLRKQQPLTGFSPHRLTPATLYKQELNTLWAKRACSKIFRITIFITVHDVGAGAVPWCPAWVPLSFPARGCTQLCAASATTTLNLADRDRRMWNHYSHFSSFQQVCLKVLATDPECPVDQAELAVPVLEDEFLITFTPCQTFRRLHRWDWLFLTWWDVLQIIMSSSKSQEKLHCHSLINRLG